MPPKKQRQPVKPSYEDAKFVIGVSVGSPDFEGERLDKILDMAKQGMEVYIELGCSLQRHTAAIFNPHKSEDELLIGAIKDGDEWLERNLPRIQRALGKKLKDVGRWETWRHHAEYLEKREQLDALYRDDVDFKQKMDKSINEVADRLGKIFQNSSVADIEVMRQHIYDYLAEETVIIMQLWFEKGYNFIIYPNKISPILQEGYERFVVPNSLNSTMLQWVAVRIKHKSRLKTTDADEIESDGDEERATLTSCSTALVRPQLLADIGIFHQRRLPAHALTNPMPVSSIEQITISHVVDSVSFGLQMLQPKYRLPLLMDVISVLSNMAVGSDEVTPVSADAPPSLSLRLARKADDQH